MTTSDEDPEGRTDSPAVFDAPMLFRWRKGIFTDGGTHPIILWIAGDPLMHDFEHEDAPIVIVANEGVEE